MHAVRYPFKLYLNLVIFAGFGQASQGMSNVLQNNKATILREWLNYFVYLLHVVTHPWKLQFFHVVLVGYGPACPKFSEATNQQHLWKGCSDFVDFLQVVICILLDIHWSYKNVPFWACIVRHSLSTNQIVGSNLKNSKRIWGIKLILCFHWS